MEVYEYYFVGSQPFLLGRRQGAKAERVRPVSGVFPVGQTLRDLPIVRPADQNRDLRRRVGLYLNPVYRPRNSPCCPSDPTGSHLLCLHLWD